MNSMRKHTRVPEFTPEGDLVQPESPFSLPYDMRDQVKWIDFSCPCNPLGTPQVIVDIMAHSLSERQFGYRPDFESYSLRTALSHYHEISPNGILVGVTPSQMIRCAAQAFQPATVGISAPCPMEYHLAITNAGHEVVSFQNKRTFATCDVATLRKNGETFDAAVLANPSFPTSRLIDKGMLREYLEAFSWVIVDESYIELSLAGESYIPLTQRYENLIVVRNPSMTFALPGMPMAYLVAHPHTIEHIKRFYDGSGVSMVGELLAQELMGALPYLEETSELLETEIPWLQCMLSLIPGVHIFPAEANYVLCSFEEDADLDLGVANARELVDRLQVAGYTVPLMSNVIGLDEGRYFCVCAKKRQENQALINVMRDIILGR